MDFSELLIRFRKERSLTQEGLADRVGVSRQSVSKWETGESFPDLPKLMQLADVLDVPMDVLCGRTARTEQTDGGLNEPSDRGSGDATNEEGPAAESAGTGTRSLKKRLPQLFLVLALMAAAGFAGWLIGHAGAVENNTVVLKEFPEKVRVYDVEMSYDGERLICSFVPNYDSPTAVYHVTLWDYFDNEMEADASNSGGVCTVELEGRPGQGARMDLVVREGELERTVRIADTVTVGQFEENGPWHVDYSMSSSY